jgi:4a-hydroxytetrahydrobiopterin dehydratase
MDESPNSGQSLVSRECVPCKGGIPPLEGARLRELERELGGGWKIVQDHHLEKEFRFKNFRAAMDFAVAIGELAERQGHHPDILIGWGKVKVTLFTHAIGGLHDNDFILASKIDAMPRAGAQGARPTGHGA